MSNEFKVICPYCSGERPLTDKTYNDGSKFDDMQSVKIEKFGKSHILKVEIKKKYFDMFKSLNEEQKKELINSFGVFINYCPICGKKLERD